MGLNTRIEQIVEYSGLNKKEFALKIGIPTNTFTTAASGKSEPRFRVLNRILIQYTEINARWLMTGEGDMLGNECSKEVNDQKPEIKQQVQESQVSYAINSETTGVEKTLLMNLHVIFEELAGLRAENRLLKTMVNRSEE